MYRGVIKVWNLQCTYTIFGAESVTIFEQELLCVLNVWVQVSKKLLNLKGLCVDYIPCVPLGHTK